MIKFTNFSLASKNLGGTCPPALHTSRPCSTLSSCLSGCLYLEGSTLNMSNVWYVSSWSSMWERRVQIAVIILISSGCALVFVTGCGNFNTCFKYKCLVFTVCLMPRCIKKPTFLLSLLNNCLLTESLRLKPSELKQNTNSVSDRYFGYVWQIAKQCTNCTLSIFLKALKINHLNKKMEFSLLFAPTVIIVM